MRLLITRPAQDARPVADALARHGIESLAAPMMIIAYTDAPAGFLQEVAAAQAVLITSANGARALARACPFRGIILAAVGDASARAARELGFDNVQSAEGNAKALAALAADIFDNTAGPLIHVAGSHVAGDLAGDMEKAGFTVVRRVLYTANAVDALDTETEKALRAGALDGVLLFSPRTAAIFAELAAGAGLGHAFGAMTAYCLSDAVADEAKALAWGRVVVASAPNLEALIEAVSGA